jgi:hypothetical protein
VIKILVKLAPLTKTNKNIDFIFAHTTTTSRTILSTNKVSCPFQISLHLKGNKFNLSNNTIGTNSDSQDNKLGVNILGARKIVMQNIVNNN